MANPILKFIPIVTVPCDACPLDGPRGNAHWLPWHSVVEPVDLKSGESRSGSASCAFCQQGYRITITRQELDLTKMEAVLSKAAQYLALTHQLNALLNEIFSLSVERQSPPTSAEA